MAPPSSTPSPRRFLLSKRPQNHSTPTPSRLSNQVFQDAPENSTPRPVSGPTPSQFAKVPRFSVASTRRASFPPRSPSPAKPQFAALGVTLDRKGDEVRETISVSDDDEEMLDNDNDFDFTRYSPPISQDSIPEPEKAAYPASNQLLPTKRRRLEIEDATSTPQATPGRFILPSIGTTRTAMTNGGGDGNSSSRPAFLTASLPAPEAVSPLPDAFSPRRRGQKFMTGGLTSELQSWVIEAAQSASQGRQRNPSRVDDYVHVVGVDKAEGDGPIFARGTLSGRGAVKAVLVDGRAKQKRVKVEAEDRVGIRLPTWDVQVSGETWIVGVDWRILEN